MAKKCLKATLANGFSIIIDFVDVEDVEKLNHKIECWKAFYGKTVVRFETTKFDAELFEYCNYYAQEMFTDDFENLALWEKLSVSEMVLEVKED